MAKKTGSLRLYKSYMFRSKDPAIDELRTVLQDHYGDRLGYEQYKDIEDAGGPSASTMFEWFQGKTKRPQNASLEAAGRSVGMKRVWVRDNGEGAKNGKLNNGNGNGKKKKG